MARPIVSGVIVLVAFGIVVLLAEWPMPLG
jgi:hypothetical protein